MNRREFIGTTAAVMGSTLGTGSIGRSPIFVHQYEAEGVGKFTVRQYDEGDEVDLDGVPMDRKGFDGRHRRYSLLRGANLTCVSISCTTHITPSGVSSHCLRIGHITVAS